MSSLLPALVYKHTITFKAELAGLPWVQAGEAGGVSSPTPVWDKPYFWGSAVGKSTFQLCVCICLCQEGTSPSPTAAPWTCPFGDALLEMLQQRLSHPIHMDTWSHPFVLLGSEQQQIPEPCWCFTRA